MVINSKCATVLRTDNRLLPFLAVHKEERECFTDTRLHYICLTLSEPYSLLQLTLFSVANNNLTLPHTLSSNETNIFRIVLKIFTDGRNSRAFLGTKKNSKEIKHNMLQKHILEFLLLFFLK